jgi:DNA-directed RNA polymerase specialized sigma24 family protein
MSAPPELAALCQREHPRLVRALRLWCGDDALAEELAQEALLKAVVHWRRVKHMSSPGGWLFEVARNQANSSHRRRAAERRAMERLPQPIAGVDALA